MYLAIKPLSDAQKNYLLKNFVEHPGKTVTQPATITNDTIETPSLFIGGKLPDTVEKSAFAKMEYSELDGGHWPMLTKPKELARFMVK